MRGKIFSGEIPWVFENGVCDHFIIVSWQKGPKIWENILTSPVNNPFFGGEKKQKKLGKKADIRGGSFWGAFSRSDKKLLEN